MSSVTHAPARPDAWLLRELGPAAVAAVAVVGLAAAGLIRMTDVGTLVTTLWRPVVTILSIMVIAASAQHLGVLSQLAVNVFALARGSVMRLFLLVFALSATTAATLNNDAAVLLLTPLVVLLLRHCYPERPDLVVPFAFAVFMAAGVAPLPVSNPINLIVADYAGITFNEYTVTMLPIGVAGDVVAGLLLVLVFRRTLVTTPSTPVPLLDGGLDRRQQVFLALMGGVLVAYPVVTALGGPVWLVASVGASISLLLVWVWASRAPLRVLTSDVSWGTLAFLAAVLLAAVGLRNAGAVASLSALYDRSGIAVVGGLSALLSALFNNHPMAFVNMLAIEAAPTAGKAHYLAALIGGDLGPRLLPTGSLAGLLWLAALRQLGVRVTLRQFVGLGILLTVPALAVSLAILGLH